MFGLFKSKRKAAIAAAIDALVEIGLKVGNDEIRALRHAAAPRRHVGGLGRPGMIADQSALGLKGIY